jgi:hypothetical protein
MLTASIGESKAWLMFQAVFNFGPRWDDLKIDPRCEVVDEHYNFDLCSQNTIRPIKRLPIISKPALDSFTDSVAANIDPVDLQALRTAIANLRP